MRDFFFDIGHKTKDNRLVLLSINASAINYENNDLRFSIS